MEAIKNSLPNEEIMTAEEVLVKNGAFYKPNIEPMNLALTRDTYIQTQHNIKRAMIEFAKIHVTAALEKISNGCTDDILSWDGNPYTHEGSDGLDRDKIMKIYPLTNIK